MQCTAISPLLTSALLPREPREPNAGRGLTPTWLGMAGTALGFLALAHFVEPPSGTHFMNQGTKEQGFTSGTK